MKNRFYQISITITVVLIVSIVLSGCKKETSPDATTLTTSASTTNTNITSPYFLQGTFGGETVTLQGTPQPFTSSFSNPVEVEAGQEGEHDNNNVDDQEDVPLVSGTRWIDNSGTASLLSTQGSIEMRKVVIRVFIAPMPVEKKHFDMLAPGTYNFTDAQQQSNGAYVTFRDGHGVLWTSKGDQTGSTIVISSRGEFAGTSTAIAGTFSAKMYDGNGNVKQLNNVSFSGLAGL